MNGNLDYIKESAKLISLYKEEILKGKSNDEIIDIGGQVIETLNLLVSHINNKILSGDILESDSINDFKNETTLFKEYFINLLDGIFNNNTYIINKYIKYVLVSFEVWLEDVEGFCL